MNASQREWSEGRQAGQAAAQAAADINQVTGSDPSWPAARRRGYRIGWADVRNARARAGKVSAQ